MNIFYSPKQRSALSNGNKAGIVSRPVVNFCDTPQSICGNVDIRMLNFVTEGETDRTINNRDQ